LLLELRDELGIVLSIVHFNHELRGAESDADERFVAELAHRHDLEFHLGSADTGAHAKEKQLSLEAAARDLRYAYFAQLASSDASGTAKLDKVATAHTLDDQAETVLMRVIRGTGVRGLGGIYPRMVVEGEDSDDAHETAAEIIRPLLAVRRQELEAYLREIGQEWREDATNRDQHFTRNRLRAQLLPLLEREFNPSIAQNLSELADIARTEEDYWDNEVAGWMGTGIHWVEPEWARAASGQSSDLVQLRVADPELERRLQQPGPLVMNAAVDLLWLHSEPHAVQRRIVKAVGDLAGFPLEFRHVEEILDFADEEANTNKRLSLPLGWQVERKTQELLFLTPDLRTRERIPEDYAYSLPVPGRLSVPEAGIVLEALLIPSANGFGGYNRDQLLDAALVSKELAVRNWRPGDRFWPAHTKASKKIKELLQDRHVSGEAKKRWPVVVSDEDLVWLRGFAVPAALQPKPDAAEAILLRDWPIEDG
jgi:tRNA(Ile)-lysidine synthase